MPFPSILTREQELLLEQDYNNPANTLRALAVKYGVDKKTIQRAAARHKWARDYGERAKNVATTILSRHADQIVDEIGGQLSETGPRPRQPAKRATKADVTKPTGVVVDHPKRHTPRVAPLMKGLLGQAAKNRAPKTPQPTPQPSATSSEPSNPSHSGGSAPPGALANPAAPSPAITSLDEMMMRFEEDVRAEVAMNIGRIQAAVTLRQLYETRQFHAAFTIMQQLVLDWLGDDPEKRNAAGLRLFAGGARTSIGHVVKQLADAMTLNAVLERKIVGIVDQDDRPSGQPGEPVEVNVTQVVEAMPTDKLRVLNEAISEFQGAAREARSLPVPPGHLPRPAESTPDEEAPR